MREKEINRMDWIDGKSEEEKYIKTFNAERRENIDSLYIDYNNINNYYFLLILMKTNIKMLFQAIGSEIFNHISQRIICIADSIQRSIYCRSLDLEREYKRHLIWAYNRKPLNKDSRLDCRTR